MSSPPPQPPHQYPQEIQLKLYQAFIFSIPILFSIILFLLFYLFYLKRRASAFASSSPVLPTTINGATIQTPSCNSDLKNEAKNKLCQILFDENTKARDSMCCVCLGEFELKEELLQVPTCKHMFHTHCIRHWLQNNSTCPLCRAPVVSDTNSSKPHHHPFSPDHRRLAAPHAQILQLQHSVRSEGSTSGDGTAC